VSVGWQVTLYDPIWQVCSSEMGFPTKGHTILTHLQGHAAAAAAAADDDDDDDTVNSIYVTECIVGEVAFIRYTMVIRTQSTSPALTLRRRPTCTAGRVTLTLQRHRLADSTSTLI